MFCNTFATPIQLVSSENLLLENFISWDKSCETGEFFYAIFNVKSLLPPGTKSYCNVQKGEFLRFPFMCELACTRWQGNGNIVQREGYFFLRYSLRSAPLHE